MHKWLRHTGKLLLILLSPIYTLAGGSNNNTRDTTILSSSAAALAFLDSAKQPPRSTYWPNVDPVIFFDNLKNFAVYPLRFYEGRSNNFCAYSALTYLPLNNDPKGFCEFMLSLYLHGAGTYRGVHFSPSVPVMQEAGLLKYKGALDLNSAAQMWFLSLADRFKGYLNVVNRHFDKGDENSLWAATNFAKFNRMVRRIGGFKVRARGSDIMRPWIKDVYGYISDRMKEGTVFLFLNNRLLYRHKHTKSRLSVPTHYIILLDIQKISDDKINIIYWDYGLKSLQQVSPSLLKKIVFGITTAYVRD